MKAIVDTAIKRSEGQMVVNESILHDYASCENQDLDKTLSVIESYDRWEIYFTTNGVSIGCMYLTKGFDMHHGDVCMVIGTFIHPDYRSDKSIKKTILHYIKSFCATYGLNKYQRSFHVDSNNQLVKTKEVTNGFS